MLKKLSDREIADAVGLSPGALSNYKNPKLNRIPKAHELLRLAKYFGVSMEYLLEGTPGVAASLSDLDQKNPLDLQADELKAFLVEQGMSLAEFEAVMDGVRSVAATMRSIRFSTKNRAKPQIGQVADLEKPTRPVNYLDPLPSKIGGVSSKLIAETAAGARDVAGEIAARSPEPAPKQKAAGSSAGKPAPGSGAGKGS